MTSTLFQQHEYRQEPLEVPARPKRASRREAHRQKQPRLSASAWPRADQTRKPHTFNTEP